MLMFLFGAIALVLGVLCLVAFAAFASTSVLTFVLVALFLVVAWWLAGKDWGIRSATEKAAAQRQPVIRPMMSDTTRTRERQEIQRLKARDKMRAERQRMRYAGLTSMDDWGSEDAPL